MWNQSSNFYDIVAKPTRMVLFAMLALPWLSGCEGNGPIQQKPAPKIPVPNTTPPVAKTVEYGFHKGGATLRPAWAGPLPADAPVVKMTVDECIEARKANPEKFYNDHADKWLELTGKLETMAARPSEYMDGSH